MRPTARKIVERASIAPRRGFLAAERITWGAPGPTFSRQVVQEAMTAA
jgi:hypothetical protein